MGQILVLGRYDGVWVFAHIIGVHGPLAPHRSAMIPIPWKGKISWRIWPTRYDIVSNCI